MSDWQRKVDFSEATAKYDLDEISIQELAKIVHEKLKGLKKFNDTDIDYPLEDLIEEFEMIAEDEEEDDYFLKEEFNYTLNRLYDWGDTPLDGKFGGKKVCWVQMR